MDRRPQLRVVLLGGFDLGVGDRTVDSSTWRLSRARDIIKVLALSPGRRLQRDQVLELLWPGRDLESAVNNLHQVLHAARQAIGAVGGDGHACLRLENETLALCPKGDLSVDADEFESLAREALDSHRRADYERALRLYSGDLLPDDRYSDWAAGPREILHRLKLDVMIGLAGRLAEDRELAAAADLLRRLLVEDATNESAHRDLMRVYALAGDRGAAARQYESLEKTLRDELGVAPEQITQDLHHEIAAGHVVGVEGGSYSAARPKTNLGTAFSSFVGRQHELGEMRRLMRTSRMVTLVGPGGCGKTRLAVEVGRRSLGHFSDGVFLIELAPVSKTGDVAPELLRTLGVRRAPDQSAAQAVGDQLAEDHTLMILDNCEHVVDEVARLIGSLLRACPHLYILATSREPIRVPGEVVRRVSSLRAPDPAALPSLDELTEYDAVQLFADRTKAAQSDFEIDEHNVAGVVSICFRLDGMPLALELAAARVPGLSVAGVARNLDDRFRLLTEGERTALSRQRTLKATVDWSFDLLTPEEKTLFLRLSVFNGPFDFEAAQAVAGSDLRSQAAPLLSRLVERSMVVADDSEEDRRYRLLETMRAYGLDRLRSESRQADVRNDHAEWLLQRVGRSGGHSVASRRPQLVSLLATVHDELRPAVDHLLSASPGDAVRLAGMLWPYWLWHAHLGEGLALIEHVLDHASGPSEERADLLIAASALAFRWKGYEEMERYAALSLEESEAVGDAAGACRALMFSAVGPFDRDDQATASGLFRRALAIAQNQNDAGLEISSRLCLAMLAASHLEFAEAGELLDRADELLPQLDDGDNILNLYTLGTWMPTRRRGDRLHMWSETFLPFEEGMGQLAKAALLTARANLERLSKRFETARSLLEEALHLHEAVGDKAGEALILCWMGQLAFDRGGFDEAERYLNKSLLIRREILHVRGVVTSLVSMARLTTERNQIEAARRYMEEAERLCRQRADRIGVALVQVEGAQIDMAIGDAKSAVRQISQALPLLRVFGGYGINIACMLRDLGEAQSAAGRTEDALASLTEAADTFERDGYLVEADRCRRLRLMVYR